MVIAPHPTLYLLRKRDASTMAVVSGIRKLEGVFREGSKTVDRRSRLSTMVSRPFSRASSKSAAKANGVRGVTCGSVMQHANALLNSDSVATVLDVLTKQNWDHVFIVDENGVPMGRIHAVDLLKMVAKKTVNRDVAWMHSIPAQQALVHPPLTVRTSTPLLKAGALMLTHDLNQLGVVDDDGVLVGFVGHSTVARVLPRFLL